MNDPVAAAPTSAKQVSPALAAALSAGDLAAATACFTRDACLLTPTRPRFAAATRSERSSSS